MASPAPSKRMSRAARRTSLLDAAASLLRDPAAGPLTFDAIAGEAGVSPTLPYKYFESVDELATELYAHLIGPVDAAIDDILGDDGRGFDDKLRATLHLWCDTLRRDGPLLLRLSDDVAHPGLRRAIDARRERSVTAWASAIETEVRLDPATARLVAGSISGGSIETLRRWIVDRLDRDETIELFVHLARAQLDAAALGDR